MFTSLVLVSLLPYVLADHDPCSGSWNNSACHVNWTVKGDCISFCVSVNSRGWVGLGFSLDQFMPKSDVVVGAADDSGNSFVVDGYANARSRPTEDVSNDLQSVNVERSSGRVTLCFTRNRVTGDTRDVPLDQCVFLLCAWNGRVNNYANRLYSYHGGQTRLSSSSPVCFPNATDCPKCPIEGQVYYGGDSCAPCDGTCKQPLVPCPLICRRGCGCPRGQVIDQAQNKCVALSECPKCEYNGQSYNPGDTFNATDGCNICHCTTTGVVICTLKACIPKKCEYNGQSYNAGDTFNATDGCNICTCSEGQVACTERACIPTCPIEGQRYFDIRNGECAPCQQTCGKEPLFCILICQSGCGCPAGQLIDPAQNKCVNSSDCTPECPIEGQIYYGDRCAPCDGTCDRPLVPCPRICRRGCACPIGQVIDPARNRCVALSDCPPRCPIQGQRYFNASKGECVPCTGTCEDTNPVCTRECRSGCGCPTGTVLDEENNRCIHPRTCPKKCEYEGEVYQPGDRWDCSDSGKCMKCWCLANGVVANHTLGCPACPIEGQRYFDIRNGECAPCQQTCGKEPRVCILICQSGCGCPVGQLIDPAQNKCVNSSDCTPECPIEGQIYYGGNRCAPCDGTCDRPLVPCPRICRRGCACPIGHVIDPARNRCVALSDCPPRCPIEGQRYFNASKGECVPCTGTCEDTNPVCTRECRSGCGCPTGTVLDEENNRCINPRTCPKKCEYEGEVYQPGDRWDCSDSGKCMKCWCLANGVVANHTLGCPVTCTHSLCEGNSNANCSIGCSSTSILTSCQACYYDDDVRSVPGKCKYKCGSNPSRNCLKKWGKCVKKRFNKKYGKARRRDRRDGLFKCVTPTPCEE